MSIKLKPNLAKRLILSAVGMAVLYLPVQQSFAQLEEIVVTARRYEESITDAPLAVAVMDNDYLKTNRIDSIQDIMELTPGSTWGQFAKAQPQLTMRGVNAANFGNASLESSVQVVYDGIPAVKAFMMTLPVYDMERVEIMRGPQGTTFGRNATLGLMHFISARPSQEDAGTGGVEASVGSLNLFGVNGHYTSAFSDTLSARFAFNYQDTDGAMEDRDTGKALEGSENISVRASILYEPSDTFSAYVKAEIVQDDELAQVRRGTECVTPWLNAGRFGGYTDDCDPFTAKQDDSREWPVTRDMFFLTAELVWNVGDISITSLSGYQDGQHDSVQDAFGTPFSLRDQTVSNDAEILSTELRIDNFASGDRLRWLAGVSYLTDEERRIELNVGFPNRGHCGGQVRDCEEFHLFTDAFGETDSLGIFGEVSFDLTEALTLTVGGRYSDDSRDMDFASFGWGEASGLPALGLGNGARDCNANAVLNGQSRNGTGVGSVCGSATNTMGFAEQVSSGWDNFSTKVSLSWAVSDNSTVYALYSEGYKAGGFQQDARNSAHLLDNIVDSEEAVNYELGWKGSYDRAIFAITYFQQEQTNAQVNNNLPASPTSAANVTLIKNTGGVEAEGIEFEGTFALTDNLTLGGSVGFYDSKFGANSFQGGSFNPVTGLFTGEDISDTAATNAPDETANIWVAYEWELAGGSSVRLRGDWLHRARVWGQNGARNRDGLNLAGDDFQYLRPELNKFGFDATWTSSDQNLSVSLWGRNLDNNQDFLNFGPGIGFIFNQGQSGELGLGGVRARPAGATGRRQIGATVRYNFGAN